MRCSLIFSVAGVEMHRQDATTRKKTCGADVQFSLKQAKPASTPIFVVANSFR